MSRIKNIFIVLMLGLGCTGILYAEEKPEAPAQDELQAPTPALAPPTIKMELADPTGLEQVFIEKGASPLLSGITPENATTVGCQLNRDAKGSVVARQGSKSLVVFNQTDWKNNCKKQSGLNNLPLVWVDNDKLKATKSLALEEFGDRCAAYEFLERQAPFDEPGVEGRGLPCSGPNCKTTPMVDAAKQFIEMSAYHFGNRCFIETDRDKQGPECSFTAMLKVAQECKNSKDKAVRCSQAECERRLGSQMCLNSPWKDKPVDERFQLIMKYAKDYAPAYGVEPRAIPCIATVETGYLEPQAKTLLACGNTRMNRYHGLGMITQQTLEHYVNPFTKFQVTVDVNGKKVSKEIKAFHSSNPLLVRPSFYACPEKLHDALGSSPDLQVELMAYTLAEKKSATRGNEYQSYVNYNGLKTADEENGRPHMNNYADAIQACVRCLRQRLPDKPQLSKNGKPIPALDPVECLSIATRGGQENHPFYLRPGHRIYDVFDGHKKRYCGEDDK